MSTAYLLADELLTRVHAIVPNTAAVRYFQGLLLHPGQPFNPIVLRHATDLEYYCDELEYAVVQKQYEHIRLGTPDAKYPLVDDSTVADCLKSLVYLNGKLDECQGHADILPYQQLQKERDAIQTYLNQAQDKRGRRRNFRNMRENDYRCVSRALNRFIDKVSAADPELGTYIKQHLTLGMSFMWEE